MSLLEALENDQHNKLPHETFVRGFIRAYAKFVGLNQDEVITNFELYLQSLSKETAPEEEIKQAPVSNNSKYGMFIVIAVLLLAGLSIAAYFALRNGKQKTADKAITSEKTPIIAPKPIIDIKQSKPVESKSAENDQKKTESTKTPEKELKKDEKSLQNQEIKTNTIDKPKPEQTALTKPKETKKHTPTAQGVVLTLKAKEKTWILYQTDDDDENDIILGEGSSKTISANQKITLTLGNAAGVEAVLNGEKLPQLGESGSVVRGLVFEAKPKNSN